MCGCTGVLDCCVNSDVCMHAQGDACTFMSYYADVLDYWRAHICPDWYSLSCVAVLMRCVVTHFWCCMHAQRDTWTLMSYYADVLDCVVTHWCVEALPKILTLSCLALLVYCVVKHWCVHAFMTWSILASSCVAMLGCSTVYWYSDVAWLIIHWRVWMYWCVRLLC